MIKKSFICWSFPFFLVIYLDNCWGKSRCCFLLGAKGFCSRYQILCHSQRRKCQWYNDQKTSKTLTWNSGYKAFIGWDRLRLLKHFCKISSTSWSFCSVDFTQLGHTLKLRESSTTGNRATWKLRLRAIVFTSKRPNVPPCTLPFNPSFSGQTNCIKWKCCLVASLWKAPQWCLTLISKRRFE